MEWGSDTLPAAQAASEKFIAFALKSAEAAGEATVEELQLGEKDLPEGFVNALNDDLNVAGALAVIYEHLKAGNQALASDDTEAIRREHVLVRSMLDLLGVDPLSDQWKATTRGATGATTGTNGSGSNGAMDALDNLVTGIVNERAQARADKDWARADQLRDTLTEAGITVEDGKDGATWHLAAD